MESDARLNEKKVKTLPFALLEWVDAQSQNRKISICHACLCSSNQICMLPSKEIFPTLSETLFAFFCYLAINNNAMNRVLMCQSEIRLKPVLE